MSQETEDVLKHYGVVGMKWGKRKGKSSVATSTTPRAPAHKDAADAKVFKTKAKTSGTDSLSNAEMKKLIERMNLEQQYSRLNPSSRSTGQKLAKDILGNTGKQLASEYAKSLAKSAIKSAIKV
jgi:hypothetical protein